MWRSRILPCSPGKVYLLLAMEGGMGVSKDPPPLVFSTGVVEWASGSVAGGRLSKGNVLLEPGLAAGLGALVEVARPTGAFGAFIRASAPRQQEQLTMF